MHTMQKYGGLAAIGAAVTFIIGFALYATLLIPAGYGSLKVDPAKHVAFLAEHKSLLHAWNLIIYVVFGILLVVLTLALDEKLNSRSPGLMRAAKAFGLIWATLVIASGMVANIGASVVTEVFAKDPATAGTVWLSLMVVINGLGGGNEIVGGLWVLLISLVALRSRLVPKVLSYLGIIVGLAGVVTVIPMLQEAGSVFGLGLILWFAWIGIWLLMQPMQRSSSA